MSWLTIILIAVGSLLIFLLLLVVIAQVRSSRHIESLKKRIKEPYQETETYKPKMMHGAQPATGSRAEPSRSESVAEPKETVFEPPFPPAEEVLPEAPSAEAEPFTPKGYPAFSNARAIEALGLSQEEADQFTGELVTQIEAELPRIEAAVEAGDTEALEKLSHMLKGSATSLGEGGVADVLVAFNNDCKGTPEIGVMREHLQNLRYYFDLLKARYAA